MPYRVETASTARATCVATECKKAGTKIEKGELRLGTWVEIQEHGGWKWRHWGCVTGQILENLRSNLADGDDSGSYRWDMLDGYGDGGKDDLDKRPDLQEKVRRVITQGFIDPEEFNGDPEMNRLGEKGLFTKEHKKKIADEAKEHELVADKEKLEAEADALRKAGSDPSEVEAKIRAREEAIEKLNTPKKSAPKKATSKKRAKDESDEEEENKPVKKKRSSKVKKEEDGDKDIKPAKTSKSKKVKKEEDDEEETKPVKTTKSKKAKEETEEEEKPVKKSKATKVKKEETDEDEEVEPAPAAKKSKAKKIQKEDIDKDDDEPDKPVAKKGRKKGVATASTRTSRGRATS